MKIFICLLLNLLMLYNSQQEEKLKAVIQIFRHAERYSIYHFNSKNSICYK